MLTTTWKRALMAACLWLLALQGVAFAQRSPFYEISARELAGSPGSIIRQVPLRGSPWGSYAVRAIYRSTGLQGQPIAVSGVFVVPSKPPPDAGYSVIAWAHPTTGVDDRCAPSRFGAGVFRSIPGIEDMVQRGFVVAATDYEGLGVPGIHPYLVGISAGRSVLDSVRAAGQLTYTNGLFAVWGHSQGGHAALWTGELAATYAADLKLTGIAAAAPATTLGELLENDLGTDAGKGLTAMTLWAWSHIYGAKLETVVLPEAMRDVDTVARGCLAGFADLAALAGAVINLKRVGFLVSDPSKQRPWAELLVRNSPGGVRSGITAPVFIAQGGRDTIVEPAISERFAVALCAHGIPVTYHAIAEVNHRDIDNRSAARAVAWMADRLAARPVPTSCRGG